MTADHRRVLIAQHDLALTINSDELMSIAALIIAIAQAIATVVAAFKGAQHGTRSERKKAPREVTYSQGEHQL